MAGEAAALKIRMCADGAYFGVSRQMQSFSGHGGQTVRFADTDIVAEFARALSEGPGLG